MLNTVLQHVSMSWITEANKMLEYDLVKNNPDWMTGGPWYSISICKKIHVKVFEEFIRNVRTDRYNLMCSIDAHEKRVHRYMTMEAVVVVIQYQ